MSTALPRVGRIGGASSVGRIGGVTSVKGSGHLTAQPDAASGSDWPAGEWRPGALQPQAWRDRLLPPVEQVRPGLWSIPVPWPDSGLRYTLAYLLDTRAGVALVDTGWPSETAWTALEDGIRVAGWLKSRGAPPNEATQITDLLAGGVARHARLARPDVEIEHGTLPLGAGTAVRAVWTPGHTPGHLCFYDERRDVLLTGDHVLPRITPHIGLIPGAEGDPLGDYHASLQALTRYDPAEVLPAHEHRFAGLGARVDMLMRHHRTRLAEIEHVVACYPGLSTWTVAEALTWSRGWEQTRGPARQAAISETWAHLIYLRARDRVVDQGGGVDTWVPGPRGSAVD